MQTTFILHGGGTSRDDTNNDAFFAEMVKEVEDGDTVLVVTFACEQEDEQEEVYQRDKREIISQTDKAVAVEQAKPEIFTTQLAHAAVIYVPGGVTSVLKERLLQYPDFAELVAGKTYAGCSAGANVVSTYHTSGFAAGVQAGLGMVPVCLMAHYGNPDFNGVPEHEHWFDDVRGDMELLRLPECEWVVKEIAL